MPPVVAIVGKSKSGKTTLIEKLISELKSRGYRVGTVKHAPLEMDVDKPGKDSWRHIRAGSEATAIVSSDRIVLIKPVTHSVGLDEVIRFFGEDYDIILAEGFKQSGTPKIEVHRKEVGPPLSSVRKLIVIATDEPLETKTRQFSLQDITGLADLLENGFIKPQRERISIYVNNNPISLTAFPKNIITNTLVAMVSSLKRIGNITSLEIFLRKKPKS
ncbi:MAG: molybdopterin-guanine dinucleotide biosynthesis protein B [Dehalococcoidia bacterium]|jgi:molybdopterin-guanine dinucleotide biosynthesis protein B|nr:molybdopterin-guanine dinucleotide biosynthesis protein B [Dehalococcoidia bacterium]